MKRCFLTIVLFVNFLYIATAQVETNYYVSESENPFAQSLNIKKPAKVHTIPLIRLMDETQRHDKTDSLYLYRFGQDIDVLLTLEDGKWEKNENGRVWSLGIESEGASSLSFIFNSIHLENGSELYIFNQDNSVVYGPVTSEALSHSSFLYTDIIPGSKISIYLYEPIENIGTSSINITKVIYGLNTQNRDLSYSGLDPACYSTFVDISDGVCMVTLPNGSAFFGTLLMTTNNSYIPYVLTAYNASLYTANQLGFRFRVRKEECNGSQQTTIYTYTGAQLKASWVFYDFALFEILSDVSKQPKISWIGWDRSTDSPTFSTSFLEGDGNLKLFFKNGTPTSVVFYNGSTGSEEWLVKNWGYDIYNAVKGSPLLNQDKRVVGQLNSYYKDMNSTTIYNYYFNKLSQSWNGGGTNSSRLSNWLDPTNTGNLTQNSALPPYLSGPNHICDSSVYILNNCPPGASVIWELNGNNTDFLSITQNSPLINQCTIKKIHSSPYKCNLVAKVYRDSVYQYSILKNNISAGTPAIGAYIIPEAPNGIVGCWSSDMEGNTFTIEEGCFWPYNRFEANLYRLDNNFNISQLVNSWDDYCITNPYIPSVTEGWYLFQLRGYNDCGYSDWLDLEVEYVNFAWNDLLLNYNSSSNTINISRSESSFSTSSLTTSRQKTPSSCELQIWDSSNTRLIKKIIVTAIPAEISLSGISNGIFIARVIMNGKAYSRIFVKHE